MATYDENFLLRALPPESVDRLSHHLVIVEAPSHAELYEAGDVVNRVYFPLDSVISMTARSMSRVASGCALISFVRTISDAESSKARKR